jgi:hypothetical protein
MLKLTDVKEIAEQMFELSAELLKAVDSNENERMRLLEGVKKRLSEM